jgi:hypothetical protein
VNFCLSTVWLCQLSFAKLIQVNLVDFIDQTRRMVYTIIFQGSVVDSAAISFAHLGCAVV